MTSAALDHKALAVMDEYQAVLAQIVTPDMISEVMKEVFDTPARDQAEAVERARIVVTTLCVAVPLLREAFDKPWDGTVSKWPVPA